MEAYEGLRQQVIHPDGRIECSEGRRILLRCGVAAWAQLRHSTWPIPRSGSYFQSASESPVLDSLGAELVRLVAGLILSTRKEGLYA